MKKAFITSVLTATLLTGVTTTAVMSSALADDAIEQQVYRSANFGQSVQKLRTSLRGQGYQVMNIKADSHKDQAALKVYAKKHNQAYEMTYSYPALKLLTSEKKAWSQLWQNEHGDHNKTNAKQRVYQDANFNSVKAKAERKLKDMGYSIDEIEVDDYQNKGILKADVDRGDKEFEIRLSYPELQILTIEED